MRWPQHGWIGDRIPRIAFGGGGYADGRGPLSHWQKHEITFQAGINEDLAATAHWGAQQAELRGEGKYDGVFGLWYGKGPGVDRSGDVMRHANMAGTSPAGGVLMAMGDDHTGESSTVLHQSEFALVDAYMPIVSPAGVQEVMDYGLYAYGRCRGLRVSG